MGLRVYLADFALANPAYAEATVSVFQVNPTTQAVTTTLAPLYADLYSNIQVANPQTLDGEGKWLQPVYVDQPVIMQTGNAGAANAATGISGPIGDFRGDWTSGILYVTGDTIRDGAAGANTSNVYMAVTPHMSGIFVTDLAAGLWQIYVSATSVAAGVIAAAVAASLTAVAGAGYLLANQTITLSGDATGSGTTAIAVTLAASGVGGGSFTKVTVDAKGRVTSGGNIANTDITNALGYTPAATGQTGIGRNLVHNGTDRVQQRGVGPWTTAQYASDGWQFVTGSGGGTRTVSLIALADADRTAIGSEVAAWCTNYVCAGGSAAGDYDILVHKIEGLKRTSGQTLTFSFWAKASSGTPKLGIFGAQVFGSGGSPSASVGLTPQSVTLSTTWTRYSATFNVPSIAGKTFGTTATSDYLQIGVALSAGATNNATFGSPGVQSTTVAFFGRQAELNGTFTPLDEPDIRYDQANCQRYYWAGRIDNQNGAYTIGVTTFAKTDFPVTMRVNPTVTVVASGSSATNVSGISVGALSNVGAFATGTATAAGNWSILQNVAATAEL